MNKPVKEENKTGTFITRTQNILFLGTAPAHPGGDSLVKTQDVGMFYLRLIWSHACQFL